MMRRILGLLKIKCLLFPTYLRRGIWLPFLIQHTTPRTITRVNLCCGAQQIHGYIGIDLAGTADLFIDLSKHDLPFKTNSLESVVCMSAINYFTYQRAQELIQETCRVLRPGGIARFGVQDLESLAKRYVDKDFTFFFQKLPSGRERFEGPTIGDKFVAWFYGYIVGGYPCQYFYDYASLAYLFKVAGFSQIDRREYRDSRLEHIEQIDNRPEQMFFLEAMK